MKKKIVVTIGTRPEVIKMAPVFMELRRSNVIEPILLATAQHRDMLDQALSVFDLSPDYDLDLMISGQTLSNLTARIIGSVSSFFDRCRPDAVLVQGDTTTVFGTAIASFYHGLKIGHIEAGLRTHTIQSPFPEEMNRRLTTPLCHWNFAPTFESEKNLLKEGTKPDSIYVTGNTVIDSLLWVRNKTRGRIDDTEKFYQDLSIPASFVPFLEGQWILMTGHRRESFGKGFEELCQAVNKITKVFPNVGILYPVHLNPSVREPVNRILGSNRQVCLIEPVDYEKFVFLMDQCTLILSDSGGIQEEAPSLGTPVLVTRETTERPEGVAAGTCKLVGTDPTRILEEVSILLNDPMELERRSELGNPYGDGAASLHIREALEQDLTAGSA